MSITETIVRRVGEVDAALTSHGKAVLAQARKPAYAWLGASEYAVSHLTELPALTQAAARGVQQSLSAGAPDVREVVQHYGEVYDGLAQRGELVAGKLRSRISGGAEEPARVATPPATVETPPAPAASPPATVETPPAPAPAAAAPTPSATKPAAPTPSAPTPSATKPAAPIPSAKKPAATKPAAPTPPTKQATTPRKRPATTRRRTAK